MKSSQMNVAQASNSKRPHPKVRPFFLSVGTGGNRRLTYAELTGKVGQRASF